MIRVAQCWDDGVATDIRLTEIFRKHNAKATFNLCPGIMEEETVAPHWFEPTYRGWTHRGFSGGRVGKKDLTKVYGGFKIASHCMKHETVGRVPLEDFIRGAVDARKILEDTFGMECPGFAWPCGATSDDSVKALRDAGFRYGRTTANVSGDASKCEDPLRLASNCHFMAPDFWAKFDEIKKTGGVFYFWGHSYEMMDCEGLWDQLEGKIAAISEDPEVQWIDVIDIVS